jgi:hypothetical protein
MVLWEDSTAKWAWWPEEVGAPSGFLTSLTVARRGEAVKFL